MSDTTTPTAPAATPAAAPVAAPVEAPASTPTPEPAASESTPESDAPAEDAGGDSGDSLDDKIAGILHDIGQFDDADVDDAAADNPAPLAVEPEAQKAAEPAKLEEKKDDELGPSRDKNGRENRIPYSRVQKIVENAKAKAVQEATASFTPKIDQYEKTLNQVGQVESLMFNKPAEFLSMLINKVPGYAQVFDHINREVRRLDKEEAAAFRPDYQAEDGSPAYSEKQMQAILAREVKRVEASLAERYKPIEESFRQEQRVQAMMPAIKAQLSDAMTWPGFVENQTAILDALKADKRISLETAYRTVVLPKLAADRNRQREDLIKELNAKPTATGTAKAASARPTEAMSTEDKIAAILKQQGISLD